MEAFNVLCRDHDRLEHFSTVPPQLMMQLGCDFFTHEQWVHIVSRMFDKFQDSKGSLVTGFMYNGKNLRKLRYAYRLTFI
jgi:hypothetical protein